MQERDIAKKRQELLDAFRLAHEEQGRAFKAWFAVPDAKSEEFESAWKAYIAANSEINRLIAALNSVRRP